MMPYGSDDPLTIIPWLLPLGFSLYFPLLYLKSKAIASYK